MESASELVYRLYAEAFPIDNDRIRGVFIQMDGFLEALPLEQNDQIFEQICRLCTETERQAFLEGFRLSAQLVLEMERLSPAPSSP